MYEGKMHNTRVTGALAQAHAYQADQAYAALLPREVMESRVSFKVCTPMSCYSKETMRTWRYGRALTGTGASSLSQQWIMHKGNNKHQHESVAQEGVKRTSWPQFEEELDNMSWRLA